MLKTYHLLQSLFKCGSRVVHSLTFLIMQRCKALRRGMVSLKEGPEATVSFSFPNIHP